MVEDAQGPALTAAGIELCKSLQHRVAADTQAAKVLQQREQDSKSEDAPVKAAAANS